DYLEFLSKGLGEDDSINELKTEGFIRLGDYVDLPFLYVDGYQGLYDDPDYEFLGKIDESTNPDLGIDSYSGQVIGWLLRIMVVGRNSFNPGAGNSEYKGGVEEAMPHLVMQFQNSPVKRPIYGKKESMAYAGSDMRKYLVKVSSPEVLEEGNFTKGLIAAGVPMDTDIIWAPNREISNTAQTDVDKIKDKLWIPTEWEMFGFGLLSNTTLENKYNQAVLEYYLGAREIKKYNKSGGDANCWNASPVAGDSSHGGRLFNNSFTSSWVNLPDGVTPAFCVK
ncbi:MAG: hypothetical protein LBV68_05765, partial [Spirochaetaceae bacterium]|nr:hypothetical protein [Spirochaetaceae bacterium]